MNLYVIGPVTGKENYNLPAFEAARNALFNASKHKRVDIPHDYIGPHTEWEWAMCASIDYITDRWAMYADRFGIAMLDGWEDSKGARIEHDLAEALGIECRSWKEWL